ncbi:MAG: hypothetical protein DRH37_01085 [Deltaproteobacteria bacterium]|nr:MAG: hypothetical protein DRH37_01085 [Deltaproteobacteria bacterium]
MPPRIGIALGGGGARGLAHVGILKVFEEENIPIHCISGSSIGAVVGAMYAQRPDAKALIQRFKTTLDEDYYKQLGFDYLRKNGKNDGSFLGHATQSIKRRIVINLAQNRNALLKEARLLEVLSRLIDPGHIEDTEIPLTVVSTSLVSGNHVVYGTGEIIPAVAASCSIPGFFPPLERDGDLLTDGGISCPVPVQFLPGMGANFTIAVEICMRKLPPFESPNVIEIISRADMITSRNLSEMMARTADIAIFPDTKDVHWSEFSRCEELIEEGIQSARQTLPEIRKALRKKRPWFKRYLGSKR